MCGTGSTLAVALFVILQYQLLRQLSVSVIDVTEDDIKHWNTCPDGIGFWAASLAVHGIREIDCIKNANSEAIHSRLTKDFGVEEEEDKKRRWKQVRRIL